MTTDERSRLVLGFARILYVNGQATEQTVSAAERLARTLGLHATMVPHWGGLELPVDDGQRILTFQVAVDPSGVEMDRVALAMRAVDAIAKSKVVTVCSQQFAGEKRLQSMAMILIMTE